MARSRLDRRRGGDHHGRIAGRDWRIGRSTKAGGGLLGNGLRRATGFFRLPATLHQQGHQTDAVNGQHEEDRDLHAGTTLVFLLQSGALWNKWILIIHFQMALLRLFIEVLVDLRSLRSGVFPQKTPEAKFLCVSLRFTAAHATVLPSILGVPPWTPLPIDFTAWQKTSPRC